MNFPSKMLENLCLSPISSKETENFRKNSFFTESSTVITDRSRVRGFSFVNNRKLEDFLLKFSRNESFFQRKTIKNFDFRQNNQKIRGILDKLANSNPKKIDVDLKKRIKPFNFRRKL